MINLWRQIKSLTNLLTTKNNLILFFSFSLSLYLLLCYRHLINCWKYLKIHHHHRSIDQQLNEQRIEIQYLSLISKWVFPIQQQQQQWIDKINKILCVKLSSYFHHFHRHQLVERLNKKKEKKRRRRRKSNQQETEKITRKQKLFFSSLVRSQYKRDLCFKYVCGFDFIFRGYFSNMAHTDIDIKYIRELTFFLLFVASSKHCLKYLNFPSLYHIKHK